MINTLPTLEELNAGLNSQNQMSTPEELNSEGSLPTLDELNSQSQLPTLDELNSQSQLPTLDELNSRQAVEGEKVGRISGADADYSHKGSMGGVTMAALEAQADGGLRAADDDGSIGAWAKNIWNTIAHESIGKSLSKNRLWQLKKLRRGVYDDYKGNEGSLEELIDKNPAAFYKILNDYMNTIAPNSVDSWVKEKTGGKVRNAFLEKWKQSYGREYTDGVERDRAMLKYAMDFAHEIFMEGEKRKMDAARELETRDKQFQAGAVGGLVKMTGYALPIAAPGVGVGLSAAIEGAAARNELLSDEYYTDKDGDVYFVKRGDTKDAALLKGMAKGTITATVEKLGGKVLGKFFSSTVGKGLGKLAGTTTGQKVINSALAQNVLKFASFLKTPTEVLGFHGMPAEFGEELIDGAISAALGVDRTEADKDGTSALSRTGDFVKEFFTADNLWNLTESMILMQAIGGGRAYLADRFSGKEAENILKHIGVEVNDKKLKSMSTKEKWRIVEEYYKGLDKKQVADIIAKGTGALDEFIKKQNDPEFQKAEAERKRQITPEMEEQLDEKIAEYASDEKIAQMIKDDFAASLEDNSVFEDPEAFDEMVAMSARKFEPETLRLKIHDIRGTSMNEGQKIGEIENLGVTDWQSAEEAGLTEKDRFGRYTGGAVRALNVIFHGTTKLQEGVKAGTVSGNLAENLLTAATCELGGRSAEERGELIDGILDRSNGDEALANAMIRQLEVDVDLNATVGEKLDRALTEAKAEVLKKRNPSASSDEVNGALVEPVEKPDGTITTTGEFVHGESGANTERPMPSTPLEGVEQASRLKGAELTFAPEGELKCQSFPEMRVNVSADGVALNNLSGVNIADPSRSAEFAAVVAQVVNIAKRNGLQVIVDEVHKPIIQALTSEIQSAGLAKTQAKLDTRSKLFSLLFKTTLGNGVTYDENSFVEALKRSSNGRSLVNNHGDIYGFVDSDSVLHFNPAVMNFNTPIHEYGHLALDAVRKINPKLWEQGKKLIKDSEYYRSIVEQSNDAENPYSWAKGNDDAICDEALATLIGDRGEKLVLDRGVDSKLKAWLKEVWKAFKGAFGLADLTDEQVEKMTLEEFVDTINAELLSGREFGAKKKLPPSEKSVKRYDEAEGSGSNGLLRWRNDRGYLFAIPVDMERTQPGGKVVFATDDANITDWIQSTLNGYDLRMSKSGKLYVKGRNGLPDELALIFGRFPTIGGNDGLRDEIAAAVGNESLRAMSVEDLVSSLKSDRANYDAWAKAKSEGKSLDEARQEEHYADEAAREEAERKAHWENSGMGILDYIRSRMEDGDPEFDLDWEIAREMANDRAEARFSRGSTAEDAAYLNAVKRGDTETAERMVREAAAKSMPDTKVLDDDGLPLMVYHGTYQHGFTIFKATDEGVYTSSSKENAEGYSFGKNSGIYALFLDAKNPLVVDAEGSKWSGMKFKGVEKFKKALNTRVISPADLAVYAREHGYDGVIIKNVFDGDVMGDDVIVYQPSQIKSADPVTYDDAGNVIPLSQRFNPKKRDIRFQYVRGVDWSDITMDIFKFVPKGSITAMGETEQSAAGLAGAIEKRGALRPWTKADSPAANAKPIAFDAADMVMFWRAVSGSLRNPHVQKGERIKGRPSAIGLNIGGDRIEIVSKLFGVIDESDIKKLHEDCRAEGYFRNENTDWCAANDKGAIEDERLRSQAELDRRTRELYKTRVETGEGGEHYATQVLGHEIGHTLGLLPTGAKLGKVGDATRTLYEAFEAELKRQTGGLELKRGEDNLSNEIGKLIAWWHGTETMPEYYAKPKEKFAELFGIFLTQPESVQSQAPKAYDLCVKLIAGNEKLTKAYQTITSLKWDGKSNDAVMAEVRKTWDKEAQDQYRELEKLTKESMSLKRDKFFYSLDDRFGPMFAVAKRSLKKLKQDLKDAVRNRTMSEQEATDIIKAHEDEINALQTSLYNFQRHTGGSTRLMVSMFDDVAAQAEKDGVNWNDVRDYAHYMRVIELGGRATAHAVDPARASAILDRMRQKLGDEKWLKIEKTWKAYRATYEKYVLDDPYVQELFDAETMKMLYNNKHYITMRHRMSLEEAKDWQERIEKSKKGEDNLWDPCIDIQRRLQKGLGGANGEGGGFVLYHLVGSFEATEDPLAATIRRAIEIKESAARNHLLKQMSDTLRSLGVKGVYDKVAESKETQVDRSVYGKFYYMDSGVKHELIVPEVIHKSMSRNADDAKWFNKAFRFWKNLVTSWSPRFVSRAYRMDISSMETNIKGMHKAPVDVLSEAFCFGYVGVPLYLVNDYVARFTRLSKTPFGKILWNENTANHYAHQAQQIVKIAYEGRYSERLAEARRLRDVGETSRAKEIEENVALAQEMMKLNIFQSNYNFNKQLAGFDGEEIMHQFGYRLNGKNDRKVAGNLAKRLWAWSKGQARKGGRWWTRLGEEQEAVPKVIAMLYQMKKGITGEEAAATAIEYGGTPNLSRRGANANLVEALTGAFWNVRKNASLRTAKAIKDHPTEWMVKNFAQTAMPTIVKYLMIGGVVEELIRNLFDDDEEKIKNNPVASMMYEYSRFIRESMKCVPGHLQRNYNVIPLAKFGNEVLAFRLKYSPEEFMIKRTIHGLFQAWGADPADPSADWSDLTKELMGSVLPDVFGENPLVQMVQIVFGPFAGNNPFDNFRGRYIYDPTLFDARGDNMGAMAVEMLKQLHNTSPLNQLGRFSDGQDRNVDYSDMPKWLDVIVNWPVVSLMPGAYLSITSDDAYIRALADIDDRQKANARIVAGDLLAACIDNGRLGGFEEGLKDLPPELKRLAIRYVLNGWRQFHMDPNAKKLRTMRRIKDPNLKRKARKWIEDAEKYGD